MSLQNGGDQLSIGQKSYLERETGIEPATLCLGRTLVCRDKHPSPISTACRCLPQRHSLDFSPPAESLEGAIARTPQLIRP